MHCQFMRTFRPKCVGTSARQLHAARLVRLYTRAMQLEVDFFCAHPHTPLPRPVRSLVVDFDDTCTANDTCSLLFEAASKVKEQVQGLDAADASRRMSTQLTATYIDKYKALLSQLIPETGTDSSAAAFDAVGLTAFLDQLSDFDAAMLQPVVKSGALAGMSTADIAAAAGQVQLQQGCRAVLQRALAAGIPTHVLSINWSSQLVHKALNLGAHVAAGLPAGFAAGPQQPLAGLVNDLTSRATLPSQATELQNLIVANELETGNDGVTSGSITSRISCARDKAWAYRALAAISNPAARTPGTSVYIGDSVTDLAALLQADYGIVIGNSSSLRRVCARYGVRLSPLVTAPLDVTSAPGVLYEACNWGEIEAFLFGPRSYEAHPYKAEMDQVRKSWVNTTSTGGPAAAAQPAEPLTNGAAKAAGLSNGHAAASAGPAAAVRVPRVLTIAGSDSGGGAGIQADLKDVHVAPLSVLAAQIDSVLGDIGADVVKTGMLPTAEVVQLVAGKVKEHGVRLLVVDPVMVSTSGHTLAGSEVAVALTQHLMPRATVITPNIPEASALLGDIPIKTVQDMCDAAVKLHSLVGCQAVLIKGGHLLGAAASPGTALPSNPLAAAHPAAIIHAPESQSDPLTAGATGTGAGAQQLVTDVLFDGTELHVLQAVAVQTGNMHGTGCTLASAISSYLAQGLPLLPAVQAARTYLHDCLRHSTLLHIGTGVQRPFNHGWRLADWQHQQHHKRQASSPSSPAAQPGVPVCRWPHQQVKAAMALYAVTDSGLNVKHSRSLEDAVQAAVAGGATIIQVREKDCDGGDFLERARGALKVCRAAGVPLVINDRVDVALALGPDVGVHVGQSDLPVHVVRQLLGPGRLIGCSTRTVEEARRAVQQGADYLGVGAVYATSTKDADVIGLEGLSEVCAGAGVPVVAIGGIKSHHIPDVLAAGAAGVALVSAIFDAPDIMFATRQLRVTVEAAALAGETQQVAAA